MFHMPEDGRGHTCTHTNTKIHACTVKLKCRVVVLFIRGPVVCVCGVGVEGHDWVVGQSKTSEYFLNISPHYIQHLPSVIRFSTSPWEREAESCYNPHAGDHIASIDSCCNFLCCEISSIFFYYDLFTAYDRKKNTNERQTALLA